MYQSWEQLRKKVFHCLLDVDNKSLNLDQENMSCCWRWREDNQTLKVWWDKLEWEKWVAGLFTSGSVSLKSPFLTSKTMFFVYFRTMTFNAIDDNMALFFCSRWKHVLKMLYGKKTIYRCISPLRIIF